MSLAPKQHKVDFSRLLNKPAGKAEKPPVLPPGNYPVMCTGHEMGKSNNEKGTPFIQFNLKFRDWDPAIEEEDKKTPAGVSIDLTKRKVSFKVYFQNDAAEGQEPQWAPSYRIDEAITALGVDMGDGRPYTEVLPETTNCTAILVVGQDVSQTTGDMFNTYGKLVSEE